MQSTAILDTHYGAVRYLYYEIFLKRKNQINDLQNQQLFLSSINKYLLCRNGQYANLYDMYTNLSHDQIISYYELQRIKMSSTTYEWLNFTSLINAPRILPHSIDGPYTVDNLALRRYTYFWTSDYDIKSNILATPFYCLDGVDHLHDEMIRWKSACETLSKDLKMTVRCKYIFHDIFYMVEFDGPNISMRFLIWLDATMVDTELYTATMGGAGDANPAPIDLMRRLYIACDSSLFVLQLSDPGVEDVHLKLLNLLIANLSNNFIVTFDGRPPKMTRTAILSVTNNVSTCTPNTEGGGGGSGAALVFESISRFGFNRDLTDQIYEIEKLSDLNISQIRTPNFLIFQHEIRVSRQPTIADMNIKLQEFLSWLSWGIIDIEMLARMYLMPSQLVNAMANAAKKQLNIVYMQKYRKFCINRENITYDPMFYEKTYVFAAKNLVCTVKSVKHLIRDVITSSPLLPACVMLMPYGAGSTEDNILLWARLTQNIIYLKRLRSIFFLVNVTLQEINSGSVMARQEEQQSHDVKSFLILNDNSIRDEINLLFPYIGINRCEMRTVTTFHDINLKCITLNRGLNIELYYFAQTNRTTTTTTTTISEDFRGFFKKFMLNAEAKKSLNERLYLVFMHLLNLYTNNIIL